MKKARVNHYINAYRSKKERSVRYCFLRNCCLFPRVLVRAIVGRSDINIVKTLEAIGDFKK